MSVIISGGGDGVYQASPTQLVDGQSGRPQIDQFGNIKTNTRNLVPNTDRVAVVTQAGDVVTANAQLLDANGLPLRAVSPTTGINQLQTNGCESTSPYANWNAVVFTTVATPLGNVNARNYMEMVMLVNITAINTGVIFEYQVQDGNGTFRTVWTETFAANALQYICIGKGYNADTSGASKPARNISLGPVGRLQITAVGTNVTLTGTVWFRTL